jgi:hypothetical protein
VLAGVEALEHFKSVLLIFAGILIFSSAKLLLEGDADDEEVRAGGSFIERQAQRPWPNASPPTLEWKWTPPLSSIGPFRTISDLRQLM